MQKQDKWYVVQYFNAKPGETIGHSVILDAGPFADLEEAMVRMYELRELKGIKRNIYCEAGCWEARNAGLWALLIVNSVVYLKVSN